MSASDSELFVAQFGIAPDTAIARLIIKNTVERRADFAGVRSHVLQLFKPDGYRMGIAKIGETPAYELYPVVLAI